MCCKFTNIIPFRSRNNIKNITDVPYTRFSILLRHALDYIHPSRVRFSKKTAVHSCPSPHSVPDIVFPAILTIITMLFDTNLSSILFSYLSSLSMFN